MRKPIARERWGRSLATPARPLSRLLTFPLALEREFEEEKYEERVSHFTRCGFLGLFLYDFFLLYHWLLTPDDISLACVLSLVIFSPMLLFTILVPTRSRSVRVREISWTAMPIVAVAFFMVIATVSASPYRPLSCYDAILVMVFTTAVQRLRLRYTLAANLGMLLAVVAAVSLSSAFDPRTRLASFIFFAVAFVLMMMGSYAIDREGRLAYLAERQTRLLNAELQRVSQLDPLTGLWNRRHLETLMALAWKDAPVSTSMTILLVDVDHFKRFNDTFGHAAGDACLIAVGKCIAGSAGIDAAVVRYGGEEFLVFLPNCDVTRASAIANLICADVRGCAVLLEPGDNAPMTVSVGVAAATVTTTAHALIRAADTALYSAKAHGRDRACVAGVDPDVSGLAYRAA